MRNTARASFAIAAILLVIAFPIPMAAAHPCDGVEPGGRCEVEMHCTTPTTDPDTGRRTSTCTYADGLSVECEAYQQPDGSELYGCPDGVPGTQGFGGGWMWVGGVGTIGGLAGLSLWASRGSLFVPALPLFSRVAKSAALEHPRRAAIFQYIEENPGARLVQIRRELELPNGDLRHHLKILQLNGLIVADRRFHRTTFHLPGARPPAELDPDAARLLVALRDKGEASLDQVRNELGWTRSKTRHWTRRLVNLGLVQERRVGRERWIGFRQASAVGARPI